MKSPVAGQKQQGLRVGFSATRRALKQREEKESGETEGERGRASVNTLPLVILHNINEEFYFLFVEVGIQAVA